MATPLTTIPAKRAYATFKDIYSIADVQRINEASRLPVRSFFGSEQKKHFGTRIASEIYKGEGGIYFVASNKRPSFKDTAAGERTYQVYQFDPATGNIWEPSAKDEPQGFNGFETAKQAKAKAQLFADNKVERWNTEE